MIIFVTTSKRHVWRRSDDPVRVLPDSTVSACLVQSSTSPFGAEMKQRADFWVERPIPRIQRHLRAVAGRRASTS